jgi:GT2 family glycosyltransferase
MTTETPVWVGSLRSRDGQPDLWGPLRPWDPAAYRQAKVLVMQGDRSPVWWSGDVSGLEDLMDGFRTGPGMLPQPELPGRPPRVPLTVAVCTRNKPQSLARCLGFILSAVDPVDEVLVVDNGPERPDTRAVVDRLSAGGARIRCVAEPIPGLSRARNTALREAANDLMAFTDDDVIVDPQWPDSVRRAFAEHPEASVVTGLVPPAELETRAQRLFDAKLTWSSNLEPMAFTMAHADAYGFIFPYAAGHFGTGANMAVRRSLLAEVGGFDVALGAGTRSRGGEDLEMFARILRHGQVLVADPRSVVWHAHLSDWDDMAEHVLGYGMGLGAYCASLLLAPGRTDVLRQATRGARHLGAARSADVKAGMPRRLLASELGGLLRGPIAYGAEILTHRKEWWSNRSV